MTSFYCFKRNVLWLESSPLSSYSITNNSTTGSPQVNLVSGDGFTASLPLPLVLASSSILQSILFSNQCCGSVGISLPAVRGTTLVLVVELLRGGETTVLTGAQHSGESLKEVQSVLDMLKIDVSVALKQHKVSSKLAVRNKEVKHKKEVENLKISNVKSIGNFNRGGSTYPKQSPPQIGEEKVSLEESSADFKSIDKNLPLAVNGMTTKNAELDRNIREIIKKKNGMWKCKVCEKISKQKFTAEEHAEMHIGGIGYKCSHCGKKCISRPSLRYHIYMHHSGVVFSCEVCQKLGLTKKAVCYQHMRTEKHMDNGTNDGFQIKVEGADVSAAIDRNETNKDSSNVRNETPHISSKVMCPKCGKAMSSKKSLRQHIGYSHPENLTICDICDFKFLSKDNFEKHMVRYHKIIGASKET